MNVYEDYVEMVRDCPFRIKPEWVFPGEVRDLFYRASYQPLLYLLSSKFCPQSILEIGVRAGYSAMALMSPVPSAAYLGLDNAGGQAECGAEMFAWGKRLVEGNFPNAVVSLVDTKARPLPASLGEHVWDLAFVDGGHDEATVVNDLRLVWPIVRVGGHVLMHDLWHKSVVRGLAAFINEDNPDFSIHTFRLVHGGVICLTKERDPWTDPTCRGFDKL